MEVHQLAYFVAVAEELNFTRGARRVRVAQSAVSAAVARLEKEFGLDLFVRVGRGVKLTQAGERLLDRARATLASIEATRVDLTALHLGLEGKVTVGVSSDPGAVDLPVAVAAFHQRHRAVRVHLVCSSQPVPQRLAAVVDGTYDLALVPVPAEPLDGVVLELIGQVRIALAVPAQHRLAARPVDYADLTEEVFVDRPVGWGSRDWVDRAFESHGASRSVPIEADDVGYAAALVAAGVGIGFLPADVVGVHPGLASVDWSIRRARGPWAWPDRGTGRSPPW